MTFKIGDKVSPVEAYGEVDYQAYADKRWQDSTIISVNEGKPWNIRVRNSQGVIGLFDEDELMLSSIDVEKTAVLLLKAKGYTVTPPEPKRTGKIAVRMNRDGVIRFLAGGNVYINDVNSWRTIAVVDWTEGEGLE